MTAATRQAGRDHARWVLANHGPDALRTSVRQITYRTGTAGPFSMGVLDVANGILATTTTTA